MQRTFFKLNIAIQGDLKDLVTVTYIYIFLGTFFTCILHTAANAS